MTRLTKNENKRVLKMVEGIEDRMMQTVLEGRDLKNECAYMHIHGLSKEKYSRDFESFQDSFGRKYKNISVKNIQRSGIEKYQFEDGSVRYRVSYDAVVSYDTMNMMMTDKFTSFSKKITYTESVYDFSNMNKSEYISGFCDGMDAI